MSVKGVSVGVEITGSAKGFKSAAEDARRATDKLKKGIDTNTSGIKKAFDSIGNAAKSMAGYLAIAFGVRAIIRFSLEATKLAATFEGVKNAFVALNTPNLLANLREATRGAVSDLSLMKAAVLAENFRIPLDELATFLEYAGNQAIRTGQGFDYLVDSIVRGLGRESTMVLDNLGLSAKELKDEIAKTGSFFTGAANVIQRDMAKAGDVADTAATKAGRYSAATENLTVAWGAYLNQNKTIVTILEGTTKTFERLADPELNFWEKLMWSGKRYEQWKKQAKLLDSSNTPESSGGPLVPIIAKAKAIETITTLRTKQKELIDELENTNIKDTKRIKSLKEQLRVIGDQIEKTGDLNDKEAEGIAQKQQNLQDLESKLNKERGLFTNIDPAVSGSDRAAIEAARRYKNLITDAKELAKAQEVLNKLEANRTDNANLQVQPGYKDKTTRTAEQDAQYIKLRNQKEEYYAELALLGVSEEQKQELIDASTALALKIAKEEYDEREKIAREGEEKLKEIAEKAAEDKYKLESAQLDKDFSERIITEEQYLQDKFALDIKAAEDNAAAQLEIWTKFNNDWNALDDIRDAEKLEKLNNYLYNASEIYNSLSDVFAAAKEKELKAAGNNTKEIEKINREWAKKEKALAIIQAIINTALGVTKALAQEGPLGIITGSLVGALGAAQVGIMASTPLAKGGIVSGPTLAQVGEYPGAKNNPEVVAPLDKLKGMLGSKNMHITVDGKLAGRDIYLSAQRYSEVVNTNT